MTFENFQSCNVRDATHVSRDGVTLEKIASKWGIGPDGRLASPSQGGFGVITTLGQRIGMFEARSYWKPKE